MKENLTEIVFIIDRSGSMHPLAADTVGGFNAMLEKQKKEEGEAFVSTFLFADESQVLHDRLPIEKIPAMTGADYEPCGCTALLDAIGGAMEHIGNIHKYARPEDVPAKTLFIITTDGMENASHTYTADAVKQEIEHRQKEDGWEFIFLAANIDAVETAGGLGIRAERAVGYCFDCGGIAESYSIMADAITDVRRRENLDKSGWRRKKDKK